MVAAPWVLRDGVLCLVSTWVERAENNVVLKKIEWTLRKFEF